MTRVLITGAGGFVGRGLTAHLQRAGFVVRGAVRAHDAGLTELAAVTYLPVGDIGLQTDWRAALQDVDAVVHLAARVHVMRESAADPLDAFRRVNIAGTRRLAEQAVEAGVRRLVYVSTIKVNGERTQGRPFPADDAPQPADPYARSKHEAEQALQEIQDQRGLEVVIVRPPLIYGAGVKGNFRRLLGWVDGGVPLPLRGVRNRRSLIGLTNLVELLRACADHPAAPGHVFLAADEEAVSTPELIRRIGMALDRPARLFPLPALVLRALSALLGRSAECERLCGSLLVDAGAAQRVLGWRPRTSLDEELARTVSAYRAAQAAADP